MAEDPGMEAELGVEPRQGAAGAARRFVALTLRAWRITKPAQDILLVCHELVANGLTHAASPVRLRLRRRGDRLLIEVADHDPTPPLRGEKDPLGDSGRGLIIIDLLATRWGYRQTPDGKVVWAEMLAPVESTEPQPVTA